MKISGEIVKEALRKIDEAKSAAGYVHESFDQIDKENPHVAEFISMVLETWKECPPPSLKEQLEILLTDLVVLVDMFRRQEEVDGLERQFGK